MKITLITICKNEETLMPFFIRHYEDVVDKIYLFDNCSTDNTVKLASKCPKIEIRSFDTGGQFKNAINAKIKNEFYKGMGFDDWIMLTDFDEFLYHKDMRGLLQSYNSRGINFPKVVGFDMISDKVPVDDGVTPITELLNTGVLTEDCKSLSLVQIRAKYGPNFVGDYNKQVVYNCKNMSVLYGLGCHDHKVSGNVVRSEKEDILLLHYKWLSRDYGLGIYKSWKNAPLDIKKGWSIADLDKKAIYYDTAFTKRIVIPGLEKEKIGAMRPPNNSLRTGLVEFIRTLPEKMVMAEVGCFRGESAAYFAKKAKKVYCIDPWLNYSEKLQGGTGDMTLTCLPEAEAAFDRVAANFPDVIIKTKGTSLEVAKLFKDEFFDMVYIDANHEYEQVLADIKAWLPKVKRHGIMAGHDYNYTDANGTRAGIEKAVRDIFGVPDRVFEDSTWMKHIPYFFLA